VPHTNVKAKSYLKFRDLETRVRGHSRSLELTRIDPPPMTSYSCSTATMGLSRTVSEINGDFSRKPQIFPTHVYFAPPLKVSPWNLVSMLAVKKIE